MIRPIVLSLALAFSVPAAHAKVFELPENKPVITVTLPDAWSPEAIDKGAQATSPDTSVYVAFEMTSARNLEKAAAAAIEFLGESGVVIDPSTQKDVTAKVAGMDLVEMAWSGRDKDGPTKVSVTLIAATPTRFAVLTYWGSPAGERKYGAQLKAIQQSIQPLGQ